MRPPEEVKKRLVRQWLDKAEQDIKACEALLAPKPPFFFSACFHAQQAAEKYLKALLTWRQVEFPKTHAIELLLDLVRKTDAELAATLVSAAELTPYGVDIRYPGEQPEPGMDDARRALALAHEVRERVVQALDTETK